jgi:hypothetical protein
VQVGKDHHLQDEVGCLTSSAFADALTITIMHSMLLMCSHLLVVGYCAAGQEGLGAAAFEAQKAVMGI